ncbi:hypothetical protein J6590_039515 [Homalodisca vitripennis]|nr:hypothetical protein J6590_039515 [Homalodisca vitripennis]
MKVEEENPEPVSSPVHPKPAEAVFMSSADDRATAALPGSDESRGHAKRGTEEIIRPRTGNPGWVKPLDLSLQRFSMEYTKHHWSGEGRRGWRFPFLPPSVLNRELNSSSRHSVCFCSAEEV